METETKQCPKCLANFAFPPFAETKALMQTIYDNHMVSCNGIRPFGEIEVMSTKKHEE